MPPSVGVVPWAAHIPSEPAAVDARRLPSAAAALSCLVLPALGTQQGEAVAGASCRRSGITFARLPGSRGWSESIRQPGLWSREADLGNWHLTLYNWNRCPEIGLQREASPRAVRGLPRSPTLPGAASTPPAFSPPIKEVRSSAQLLLIALF